MIKFLTYFRDLFDKFQILPSSEDPNFIKYECNESVWMIPTGIYDN